MISYNFKYELKLLLRSKWILLLSVILLFSIFFAGFNGKQKVDKRKIDIEKVTAKAALKDQVMLKRLDSIEKGLLGGSRSGISPITIGYDHPRVAAFNPQPLTFISVGQSDLFTHYVQPKIRTYGEGLADNYAELSNPVQLLFGSFDISFIIIYILPLIIIAFTYNTLSSEKEYGSLKLLASQPISIYQWLLQKTAIRFCILSVIMIIAFILGFIMNGFGFLGNIPSFLYLMALVITYMLFWFTVSLLINIVIGDSAKNAVSLLGIWVIVILVIPAVVSQFGNVIYPIPSRTEMLNKARVIKDETSKKQNKILDNFLRDHPEYASEEGEEGYSYWQKYMATQKLIEKELSPLLNSYEAQLQEQQQWIKNWQYASPAILLQQNINNLAATSTAHYDSYRKQVAEFTKEWRNHFVPMIYTNTSFKYSMYDKLPVFEYSPPKKSGKFNILVLLIFTSIILMIAGALFAKKMKKGTIIAN